MGTYDRAAQPDLANEASPWTHVARAVPEGASVVDVGCYDGGLLAALAGRGARRVRGIERDPDAARKAAARGLDVSIADLDDAAWPDALGGERFDRVLLVDVIEHVVDPRATLDRIVERVLAPGGRIVVSVPNVAHASVRLALLAGDFERTDRGVLDRTHLHFFTRRSLHALLRDAGLAIVSGVDVVMDLPDAIVEAALARAGIASTPALVEALTTPPDARAYQFVWTVAAATPGTAIPPPPAASSADWPRAADRLMRSQASKIRRLEERIGVLEGTGPLRLLRYVRLRLRQRRERRRGPS